MDAGHVTCNAGWDNRKTITGVTQSRPQYLSTANTYVKQECIPVGYVPPASVVPGYGPGGIWSQVGYGHGGRGGVQLEGTVPLTPVETLPSRSETSLVDDN